MSSDEEEVGAEGGEEVETESQVTDLTNSDVVTKYQEAAKIVNLTIKGLALKCTAGTGAWSFVPAAAPPLPVVRLPTTRRTNVAVLSGCVSTLGVLPSLLPPRAPQ
jgi:hypothetical protein